MGNTLEMTRSIMTATPQRWSTLVESLPDELMVRSPKQGEWAPVDCLRHLVMVERDLLGVRFRHILEGRPKLVPVDPDEIERSLPEGSPRDLLATFVAARHENLDTLANLGPEDLNRSSFHPEYGVDITLAMLLDHWTAHDLQHTVQAEEAMMQTFIPGTGPWRSEFADHDVEAKSAPNPVVP
jgi:uncharacterized damage-inducible protein DinB